MSSTNQRIACLGPEGSFSHEFAKKHFANNSLDFVEGSFEDVLRRLVDGNADKAVIPFLNSNGSHVRPAQEALGHYREEIHILGCVPHRICHDVVVAEGFLGLEKLVSKEQVFSQCKEWLTQWKDVKTESAESTSAALKNLLKAPLEVRRSTGAICNGLAQQIYGGTKLFQNIQDPKNTTLFLVVSRSQPPSLTAEQLLVCLTCPTEECYRQTISDFSFSGFPLMFTSISGEFSETLPCFLQFQNSGQSLTLRELLVHKHRTLIGGTSFEESLSACTANLFDQDY